MRITEQDNPITSRIEEAQPAQIRAQIAEAEGEIFGSPTWGPGLKGLAFTQQMHQLREIVEEVLAADGMVILSGAGTSGRIALQMAATVGPRYGGRIKGLLAGGIGAFFKAKEGVEDSPAAGREDLVALVDERPFVLIGITCGLSAAYVAGQVAWGLGQPDGHVVVLGFNPIEQANQRLLPGLNTCFRDLLLRLVEHPRGWLLNPVVGPEPITGSTRMKGGSATRFILELLLNEGELDARIERARVWQAMVYRHAEPTEAVMRAAANAFERGGSLCYLAPPREALTAMLDASECPPTFGATPTQVRCFTEADFAQLLPGFALADHLAGSLDAGVDDVVLCIAFDRFNPQQQAWLDRDDTLAIPLLIEPALHDFLSRLDPHEAEGLRDLALKWLLNLISTGAFILYGKVHGNRMIDLRISNLKLWERAIRIVADAAGVTLEQAETAIIACIPGADEVSDTSARVALAVKKERVIPTAIQHLRG